MFIKDFLKRAIGALGYDVRKRTKATVVGGRSYSPVLPGASYSPWLDDDEFSEIYNRVRPHTLVDRYRCYELWELVGQLGHRPGDILEVGVWRGGSGVLISQRATQLKSQPTVYLCDTFTGVVKVTDNDSTYQGGEHADTSETHIRNLISKFGLNNAKILTGIFPDDHVDQVKDKIFCLVTFDVDVYQSAKDVFNFAWDRMPVGGVVVFDDFGFETCDGIPKLVAEFQGDPDKLIIHNLNGPALIVTTA